MTWWHELHPYTLATLLQAMIKRGSSHRRAQSAQLPKRPLVKSRRRRPNTASAVMQGMWGTRRINTRYGNEAMQWQFPQIKKNNIWRGDTYVHIERRDVILDYIYCTSIFWDMMICYRAVRRQKETWMENAFQLHILPVSPTSCTRRLPAKNR